MNSRKLKIEEILKKNMEVNYLEVINESHMHSVPENSETHFKLVLVSEVFRDLSRVARQRLVNEFLKSEFESGLHALAMRLYSPAEWEKSDQGQSFQSPDCHGGMKK